MRQRAEAIMLAVKGPDTPTFVINSARLGVSLSLQECIQDNEQILYKRAFVFILLYSIVNKKESMKKKMQAFREHMKKNLSE